jgi:hypothetical protein
MDRPALAGKSPLSSLLLACARSLYPLAALGILLGTVIWGPWVSLLLAFAWWSFVTRFA